MTNLPKPPKKRWYKRVWIWLGLLFLIIIGVGIVGKMIMQQLSPVATVTNQEVTVQVRDLSKVITTTGKLAAEHSETLSYAVPAEVTKVNITAGEEVTDGAVLIESNLGKLKAPFDGRVLSVNTFVGDVVTPGVTIVEVGYRTNFVDLIASESEVIDVQVGQAVELTVPSFKNGSETYHGTVESVDIVKTTSASLSAQSSSSETGYLVRIRPSDLPSDIAYLIGLTINVSIIVDTKTDVVSVERAAVQYRDDDTAYVLLPGNIEQTVETGFEGDDYIELTSGVAVGDIVVLNIPQSEASSLF